eukprot:GHVS01107248.1.p1 GENE.GHVS01107248.1~~GHVS01107248.1.p1  ORF type:complete len:172 (+),score=19.81 GHVS01107248.1:381-896(+)
MGRVVCQLLTLLLTNAELTGCRKLLRELSAVEAPIKTLSVCVRDAKTCLAGCQCLADIAHEEAPRGSSVHADVVRLKGMPTILFVLVAHAKEPAVCGVAFAAIGSCAMNKVCAESIGKRGVEAVVKALETNRSDAECRREGLSCLEILFKMSPKHKTVYLTTRINAVRNLS